MNAPMAVVAQWAKVSGLAIALAVPSTIGVPSVSLAQPSAAQETAQPGVTNFSDIQNNVYQPEILAALQLGIISGFPDGTFRPNESVTREQAVSMIVDALATVVPIDVNEQPTRRVRPYLDIDPSRWSAAKINWAQWNFSVLAIGTYTGNFRPTDPITRSDLVNLLRSAAENLKLRLRRSSYLKPTQDPITFTDVAGPDKQLTLQMSAYCGIASPVNEQGTKFAPEDPASRAYTAAAIVRTLNCVKADTQ